MNNTIIKLWYYFLTMDIEDYTFTLPSRDDKQVIEGIKVLLPDGFTNKVHHLIHHTIQHLLSYERRWRQQGPDDNKCLLYDEEGGKKTEFVLLSPLEGDTWKMNIDVIEYMFNGGCNCRVEIITKTD